mmetsp:Transcript_136391/g.436446  ORF Transcript_136391/g.436446 Transcript_136391/m.436446 type:complete len:273 (+) Transcript_136391:1164-1982(+)
MQRTDSTWRGSPTCPEGARPRSLQNTPRVLRHSSKRAQVWKDRMCKLRPAQPMAQPRRPRTLPKRRHRQQRSRVVAQLRQQLRRRWWRRLQNRRQPRSQWRSSRLPVQQGFSWTRDRGPDGLCRSCQLKVCHLNGYRRMILSRCRIRLWGRVWFQFAASERQAPTTAGTRRCSPAWPRASKPARNAAPSSRHVAITAFGCQDGRMGGRATQRGAGLRRHVRDFFGQTPQWSSISASSSAPHDSFGLISSACTTAAPTSSWKRWSVTSRFAAS